MKASLSLIKIAMGCDLRIPRNAMGYIDDLRANAAPEIIEDRLVQLARYVPDLAGKYRAERYDFMVIPLCHAHHQGETQIAENASDG